MPDNGTALVSVIARRDRIVRIELALCVLSPVAFMSRCCEDHGDRGGAS